MELTDAEYFAIFDADLFPRGFLLRTIPFWKGIRNLRESNEVGFIKRG